MWLAPFRLKYHSALAYYCKHIMCKGQNNKNCLFSAIFYSSLCKWCPLLFSGLFAYLRPLKSDWRADGFKAFRLFLDAYLQSSSIFQINKNSRITVNILRSWWNTEEVLYVKWRSIPLQLSHRLHVVCVDIQPRQGDLLYRRQISTKIRGQTLNQDLRAPWGG